MHITLAHSYIYIILHSHLHGKSAESHNKQDSQSSSFLSLHSIRA